MERTNKLIYNVYSPQNFNFKDQNNSVLEIKQKKPIIQKEMLKLLLRNNYNKRQQINKFKEDYRYYMINKPQIKQESFSDSQSSIHDLQYIKYKNKKNVQRPDLRMSLDIQNENQNSKYKYKLIQDIENQPKQRDKSNNSFAEEIYPKSLQSARRYQYSITTNRNTQNGINIAQLPVQYKKLQRFRRLQLAIENEEKKEQQLSLQRLQMNQNKYKPSIQIQSILRPTIHLRSNSTALIRISPSENLIGLDKTAPSVFRMIRPKEYTAYSQAKKYPYGFQKLSFFQINANETQCNNENVLKKMF